MVAQAPFAGLAAANATAAAWCAEVNGVVHSEICAVPAERMLTERELLGPLPSLRASIGKMYYSRSKCTAGGAWLRPATGLSGCRNRVNPWTSSAPRPAG